MSVKGSAALLAKLRALVDEIALEANANPQFAKRLAAALAAGRSTTAKTRRNPARLDPFQSYASGEEVLRSALGDLSLEELKDVVAEHGMDQSKLAMRWKSRDRIVELIVDSVKSRASKGEAFI